MIINKHLFAAYCGMIKSGYDLADLSDEIVVDVYDWIKGTGFNEEILEYFRFTRTDTVSVNPYYPRGSDLSVACFYQDKSLEEYRGFLHLCESPEADNPVFIKWVSQLPDILTQIENYEGFIDQYVNYCEALEKRFADVSGHMEDIEKTMKRKPFCTKASVDFAPNLLQSKYLADYALVDDTLYVISGIFRRSAVIHEYLHLALKPMRGLLIDIVQKYGIEKYVDVKCMLELGYLRGDSIEDKAHTLDECIVRVLCGLLDNTLDIQEYCRENVQYGFHSVPWMMGNLSGCKLYDHSLYVIILMMTMVKE